MATGKGPHTSEWIKSNGEKETEIVQLKGKVENFVSSHPLQLKMSQVFKFSKALVDVKNHKWEDKTWHSSYSSGSGIWHF
jgi:hypothetical protein